MPAADWKWVQATFIPFRMKTQAKVKLQDLNVLQWTKTLVQWTTEKEVLTYNIQNQNTLI